VTQQRTRRAPRVIRPATAVACLVLVASALLAGGCQMQSWDEWQNQWQSQWQPWKPWEGTDKPRAVATPTPLPDLQDVGEFNQAVLQAKGPVLVDFYKDSCPTCVLQDAVLEELNGEYAGRVRFYKFKVREATMISTCPEFMDQQRLFWVPTTVLYVNGQEQQRWTLNHAAWEFRPSLNTACGQGPAGGATYVSKPPPPPPDANGECTGEGCPINRPPPRLTSGSPQGGTAGSTPKDTGVRLVP